MKLRRTTMIVSAAAAAMLTSACANRASTPNLPVGVANNGFGVPGLPMAEVVEGEDVFLRTDARGILRYYETVDGARQLTDAYSPPEEVCDAAFRRQGRISQAWSGFANAASAAGDGIMRVANSTASAVRGSDEAPAIETDGITVSYSLSQDEVRYWWQNQCKAAYGEATFSSYSPLRSSATSQAFDYSARGQSLDNSEKCYRGTNLSRWTEQLTGWSYVNHCNPSGR